jgi:hypothetical protein
MRLGLYFTSFGSFFSYFFYALLVDNDLNILLVLLLLFLRLTFRWRKFGGGSFYGVEAPPRATFSFTLTRTESRDHQSQPFRAYSYLCEN